MADENTNHPEEKERVKEFEEGITEKTKLTDEVQYTNGGNGGEVRLDVNEDSSSEVSFSGLGKEELMQYANDPFWRKLRIILFAAFWLGWIVMLVAAILIIIMAPRCPERPDLKWYETNVVYKMDPKSFKDSSADTAVNGKGLGDLGGIESKITYIQSLGANALWISSFFKTEAEFDGNAIVNHNQVEEALGSMGQFEAIRKDTKKKGMKIVLDFIPNHTGKKHEWFMKSQQKEDEYANYYIWADKPNTTVPNNWKTVHGKQAWSYDNTRKQWYYFSYLPEYPDLNLNNPKVLAQLDGILRFWLDKGVDGFNIDGLQRLVENNDTTKTETMEGEFTVDQPKNLELVKRWRAIIDSYSDKPGRERALFGHVTGKGNNTEDYYKAGIQVLMTDALIDLDLTASCDSACLEKDVMEATEETYRKGWMVGNEQTTRFGSRVADAALQRVYQVLQFLLPGTPIVYYGDEIAMVDGVVTPANQKDPAVKYGIASKDPYRTPMLWNNDDNAGFSAKGNTPWLPVNADYKKSNVQFNIAHMNGFSVLESFKALVHLRDSESFQWGKLTLNVDEDIMYFTRKAEGFPGYLVAINRGDTASYSFSAVADMMTLVYNSEDNMGVDKAFNMKLKQLAFNKGQIYVFQY